MSHAEIGEELVNPGGVDNASACQDTENQLNLT
jgi:hypothetical protein